MTNKMTRAEEHDFYADPKNQVPQGPARRRKSKLTELVPVRFRQRRWTRSATRQRPMIAPCRHGSDAPSNTNWNTTRPDSGHLPLSSRPSGVRPEWTSLLGCLIIPRKHLLWEAMAVRTVRVVDGLCWRPAALYRSEKVKGSL